MYKQFIAGATSISDGIFILIGPELLNSAEDVGAAHALHKNGQYFFGNSLYGLPLKDGGLNNTTWK